MQIKHNCGTLSLDFKGTKVVKVFKVVKVVKDLNDLKAKKRG